jgi:hypothetical protein
MMSGMLRTVILAAAVTAPLAAQSTGTPVYAAPYRAFDMSEIALSIADPGPGVDFEASYREAYTQHIDLGIRGGFHGDDGPGNHTSVLLGGDFRARVLDHGESFPLDGSLTLGLGMESGRGGTVGYLPIGFSMGRRLHLQGSSMSIVPYVQPVLMPIFGAGRGTDFTLGFGADLKVSPRLDLRVSGGIGDRDGVGFTAAFLR